MAAARRHPPRHLPAEWDDPTLWQFGNREQHGSMLQRMQFVPRLGNDRQVTVAPFPLHAVSDQPHPTMQHLHGRLAGVLCSAIVDPAVNAIRVWRSTCSWPP